MRQPKGKWPHLIPFINNAYIFEQPSAHLRRWLFTSGTAKFNFADGRRVVHKRMKGTIDYEPLTKEIRTLQTHEGRRRSGLFCIEGIRFLIQARKARVPIKTVIVCDAILTSEPGRRLIRDVAKQNISVVHVPPEVFYALSRSNETQGVLAVVEQRWVSLPQAKPKQHDVWVALAEVQSPGNLGTAIRSADAVGARGLILTDASVDPFDPGCVRATMGSVFALDYARASLLQLDAWKKSHGARLIGTSPLGARNYTELVYDGPTILFMGGERKGLSEQALAMCDEIVKIPMVGTADSLNLGVATSLMLYEIFNQRRAAKREVYPCQPIGT